jgi:alpha-glucosidase
MNLRSKGNGFYAVFAPFVTKETYKWPYRLRLTAFAPFSGKIVKKAANYIAQITSPRALPWRVLLINNNEIELNSNRLVYLLARKPQNQDFSWVKPGLVAWDWYNHWELTGVDFKPGKNTTTYKYFIDFAAKNGIPYINLDEGWNHNKKIFQLNKDIDVHEIIKYGKSKNVGVFLWFMWDGLEDNLESKLDSMAAWGVAGLKIDFFDRDDQKMVAFSERLASEAAKRKLMLNLHGIWKPTGLERLYPNIVNREGVIGLENNKFSHNATATHNLTLPYTRLVMGSADYTPGALFNVKPEDYKKNWSHPVSQTTRCQQLAMYVCYYGALQMLPEAPTAYEQQPEMLALISKFPTTWDKSIPLEGKVADYFIIARQKADDWYVGGMTVNEKTVTLDFKFLDAEKTYQATLYIDGNNPTDYKMEQFEVKSTDKKEITMKKTGGFVLVLK